MDGKTREQYAKWLGSIAWHYFFTGTFREDYSIDGTRRAGSRFFSSFPGLDLCVLFIESGSLYGKIHLHGLVRFNSPIPSAGLIWQHWFKKYGRCRVEAPKNEKSVASYCSKYVTKQQKDETWIIV